MDMVIMWWVWLKCVGVVSGCLYGGMFVRLVFGGIPIRLVFVRRYIGFLITLLIPTPLISYLFLFAAASLLLCPFKNVFSVLIAKSNLKMAPTGTLTQQMWFKHCFPLAVK